MLAAVNPSMKSMHTVNYRPVGGWAGSASDIEAAAADMAAAAAALVYIERELLKIVSAAGKAWQAVDALKQCCVRVFSGLAGCRSLPGTWAPDQCVQQGALVFSSPAWR